MAVSESTLLAVERTRLAYERTLMAWVRTAVSLISASREAGAAHAERAFGSREFALTMIILGLASLALATLQHRLSLVKLRGRHADVPYSMTTVLAGLVAILGLLALVLVIFRQ
jgi:putative membrane protein